MPLIDDLHSVLGNLAPKGWAALFDKHGLDITVSKAKLAEELIRPLTIDRTLPGFEEFALDGVRGVEKGRPGLSLLYHALASADVRPLKSGALASSDFPTLEQLDVVENYVYRIANRRITSFSNPVVAVFAFQYRGRALSPHRLHADLAFSRTGVARVGTEALRYDGETRAFDPRPAQGARGFAALPARYAAFIAEYRPPSKDDSVLRFVADVDANRPFLFPVHKLFAGTECLFDDEGKPLTLGPLRFRELHVNEKLRRMHLAAVDNPGRVKPLSQFDVDAPPFRRTSADSNDLVKVQKAGASILIVPVPGALARTARQKVGSSNEVVRFKVPKANDDNRFWSSLELPAGGGGRAAPEYANIRQEVRTPTSSVLVDLNLVKNTGTPAADRFDRKLANGGYEAAHLIDGTCDGAVSIEPPAALALPVLPAYSLVTAVDYFPLVEQVEIEEWVEKVQGRSIGLARPGQQFQHPVSGPKPLSDGRFEGQPRTNPNRLEATRRIPNPHIPDPVAPTQRIAFDPTERTNQTATAVVGSAPGATSPKEGDHPRRPTSWLPDSASDVFAPGWDVSQHTIAGQSIYAAYGLGSPFPEDSKLCAALNSFWPAVAPDSSRTYGFWPDEDRLLPTAIPLLDSELGYHATHPRVLAGEVASAPGWDGDFGPFIDRSGAAVVDASNPLRADQSRAALDGNVRFAGLDQVDSKELTQRMSDLRFCRTLLTGTGIGANPWLVCVERVPEWKTWTSGVLPRANAALQGRGYIYVFARVDAEAAVEVGDPPLRRRFPLQRTLEIQLTAKDAYWRLDNAAFKQVSR